MLHVLSFFIATAMLDTHCALWPDGRYPQTDTFLVEFASPKRQEERCCEKTIPVHLPSGDYKDDRYHASDYHPLLRACGRTLLLRCVVASFLTSKDQGHLKHP